MKDRQMRCGWVAGGLMLAVAAGCQSTEPTASKLPANVQLPHGFRTVPGHEPGGQGTDYNGWPRYIYSAQDRMVMVYVPSQTILMGGGTQADEVPERHVQVNHFYIDLHEVTNAQFDCFVHSGKGPPGSDCKNNVGCTPCQSCCAGDASQEPGWIGSEMGLGGNCFDPWKARKLEPSQIRMYRQFWTPNLNDHHPVRNVSWREAWLYTRWTGKRLPSEAQWEAAARGRDGRIYPWGNESQSDVTRYLCNSRTGRDNWDGYEYTAPVMSYAAGVSPAGAFNMSGNVSEWCGDWYDPGRYAYPSDEDPPSPLARGLQPFDDRYYPNAPDKDIPDARVGPPLGSERAIRGGAFSDPIERCRVDSRWSAGQDVHMNNVGFRTVLLLPPPKS